MEQNVPVNRKGEGQRVSVTVRAMVRVKARARVFMKELPRSR
jgi:hypothetical protein